MLVRSSKILAIVFYTILFYIVSLITVFLLPTSLPILENLQISFSISLIVALIFTTVVNYDIEFVEETSMVCGPVYYGKKRVPLINKYRKQMCVVKSNLNTEVSTNIRNGFTAWYFNIFTIYNKDGQGINIYQRFFFKKDLIKIKDNINEMLGIKVE